MKVSRFFFALAFVCVSFPAVAHHGVSEYEYNKTVIAKVTVTRYVWANPHCKIHFDAAGPDGKIEDWVVEAHPPLEMTEHGWTRQTLHPGDEITVNFRPGKKGGAQGLLVKVIFPNGRELLQNALLVPEGQVYSLDEWQKIRAKMP
jgi:hypothetical protein